jgi:hypothetical protein
VEFLEQKFRLARRLAPAMRTQDFLGKCLICPEHWARVSFSSSFSPSVPFPLLTVGAQGVSSATSKPVHEGGRPMEPDRLPRAAPIRRATAQGQGGAAPNPASCCRSRVARPATPILRAAAGAGRRGPPIRRAVARVGTPTTTVDMLAASSTMTLPTRAARGTW